jgi:hypothetical protein
MTSPLVGLAKTVNKAFKGIFFDAVLTRDGTATGPDYDPTPGTAVDYPCKALATEYSTGLKGAGLVGSTDFNILILAGSISVKPQSLDRLSIPSQGIFGTIAPANAAGVKAVTSDPAKATWQCRTVT